MNSIKSILWVTGYVIGRAHFLSLFAKYARSVAPARGTVRTQPHKKNALLIETAAYFSISPNVRVNPAPNKVCPLFAVLLYR